MAARATAVAAFAWLLTSTSAWAEKPNPSTTSPAAAGVTDKAWPITLTESREAKGPAKPLQGWKPEEIAEAVANCKVLLDGLDVVALAEAPMREGGSCGTAAPMKLVSIGRGAQEVSFQPQPTVTCEMIAGLARWLKQDVQPLARRYLGGQVARIETMSSYSCRNAYGLAHGRLSQHGRANALDIGNFITAKNQVVNIESDWGMTARDVAALRKEQEAQRAQQAIRPADKPPVLAAKPVPAPAPGNTIEAVATSPQGAMPSLPGITWQVPGGQTPMMGFGPPSRLGGPKPRNAPSAFIPAPTQPAARTASAPAAPTPASSNGKLEFLREAHKTACRTFGTVLGPEANRTHRNHFHVDMAERVNDVKVCE
jgi:hypothetical protein